jgi:hypothetical protein
MEMNRGLKILLWVNLAGIATLAFAYPHLMIAPGRLIEGHRAYEQDCFACHTPLLGASSKKCIACHKPAEIGVRTTQGAPIAAAKTKVPFHQKLLKQDCVACHSDHAGAIKYRAFQHFSHGLLEPATRAQCIACHARPTDALHRQVSENCAQCHGTERWKPATFDHRKSFVLDKDHNVKCAVCHTAPDYKKYTCYGCHEHSPAKIRKEHAEHGIRDFENCVACHRSADEHEAKRAWDAIRRGLPSPLGVPGEADERKRKKKDKDDDD